MNAEELFRVAADAFFADPRVSALPCIESDEFYFGASSHRIDESEEIPAGYISASLVGFSDGFIASFPEPSSFLGGPTSVVWHADGSRVEYFSFPGEEEARELTAHERLRYETHRRKSDAEIADVSEENTPQNLDPLVNVSSSPSCLNTREGDGSFGTTNGGVEALESG